MTIKKKLYFNKSNNLNRSKKSNKSYEIIDSIK
jgi:hypothetical protein